MVFFNFNGQISALKKIFFFLIILMTNVREVNLVFKMLVIFLNIKILARYTAKSVIFFKI